MLCIDGSGKQGKGGRGIQKWVIVMKYLSKELQELLSKQMLDAPTLEECMQCEPSGGMSHHCCKTPGFAIYENIQLIYSEYISHLWEVVPFGNNNLSMEQFIQFYFTQVIFTSTVAEDRVLLKLYFPKIIDHTLITDDTTGKVHLFGPRIMPDADLDLFVSFPDDFTSFYAKRNYERPTNQGCVFLQRGEDFHIKHSKGCLLQADSLTKQITTKPIDCVSFNCKLRDSEKEKEQKTIIYFGELLMQFGTVL
ncbi:MAG: hypothetical protein ISS65_12850 [Desulfobacterales bacterium]|nr:hypothetical protein [Desulfobacterales bacterium]